MPRHRHTVDAILKALGPYEDAPTPEKCEDSGRDSTRNSGGNGGLPLKTTARHYLRSFLHENGSSPSRETNSSTSVNKSTLRTMPSPSM